MTTYTSAQFEADLDLVNRANTGAGEMGHPGLEELIENGNTPEELERYRQSVRGWASQLRRGAAQRLKEAIKLVEAAGYTVTKEK